MKFAIYSRKSKFTGKGESVENQIQLCKEYAYKHFGITEDNIKVYEDEGFSGGNIDRPQFQLMIKDAKDKKFDTLICYRLDRISRNITDFSSLIDEIQDSNISFISIREQFDTTTPMGRAMMYIASVFAQLERETIAERIRDNMLQLAKTGRWLGGNTPTGFNSERCEFIDSKGKQRKYYKLSPIKEELDIVKIIYEKFIEFRSLNKVETFCIQNDIKTKNGLNFTNFSIKCILNNPVYATADKKLYDYFTNNNHEIYADESDFDGNHGIMAYNKTFQRRGKANKMRDTSEWIIAVGAHEGIISSDNWIDVQKLLNINSSRSIRSVKNASCLLSGLLRCADCGSYMRPKYGRVKKDGEKAYYYMCELKEKSRKQKCDINNVNGNDLDKLIIKELKSLASVESNLYGKIKKDKVSIETSQNSIKAEIKILESSIRNNEQSISNLVMSLSQAQNTSAEKYIIDQINSLDEQNANMKTRLLELREKSDNNQHKEDGLDLMKDMLATFTNIVDSLDIHGQRSLIKNLVDKVVWDGEKVDISLFGAATKKK
ncbi:recombinase family protein [Brassicibacter mesophilus]|uniref:recombinase family protein n=1 Tax=Brassicibacter mesophilus TaxID=745119 RepID=UPI003D1C49BD